MIMSEDYLFVWEAVHNTAPLEVGYHNLEMPLASFAGVNNLSYKLVIDDNVIEYVNTRGQ